MNTIEQTKNKIDELKSSTGLSLYYVCGEILRYLEKNPNQNNITLMGLVSSINQSDVSLVIRAAFTLAEHPFSILDVRYKLYDELKEEVTQEISQTQYINALNANLFIDDEGNELSLEQLNSRSFPYFINLLNELDSKKEVRQS